MLRKRSCRYPTCRTQTEDLIKQLIAIDSELPVLWIASYGTSHDDWLRRRRCMKTLHHARKPLRLQC
eukprot:3466074-Amphidinium_carterae.1